MSFSSGLSPVQMDNYNYFIAPSSVWTLLSMKYFMLKLAISGNSEKYTVLK